METGPRKVAFVRVRRNLGAGRLQNGAVAHRAAADANRAGRDLDLLGREHTRLALQDENLTAPGVDHWNRAGSAGGKRVEGRNAGDRHSERERQVRVRSQARCAHP